MPSARLLATPGKQQAWTRCVEPLVDSGSLQSYAHQDLTPAIGRRFDGLQIVDLLRAPDGDRLIRDLAVTGTPSVGLRRCSVDVKQSRAEASSSCAAKT